MDLLPKSLMSLINPEDAYLKHIGGGHFQIVDARHQVILFQGTIGECTDWLFNLGQTVVDLDVRFKVQYFGGNGWIDQFGTEGMSYQEAVDFVRHVVKHTDKAWRVVQITQTSVYEEVKE